MKNQTATDFIKEELDRLGLLDKGQVMTNIFEKAKAMEKQQSEKKDSIINQIDLELSLIEDYAKGEVGDAITLLRKKIDNYYKTNGYE